nr:response regulator receiver protein CpdR [uncultured bacterium]
MPKHILIVEDDPDFALLLAEVLESADFTAETAPNGRMALERLRRSPRPNLVLLDLMMPVMDGWQFRSEQQKDADIASVPVVVLSADGNVARKASSLRAEGHLTKPPGINDLVHEIERVLARPASLTT